MIFAQSFQVTSFLSVIPAKAGIQCFGGWQPIWTPAFAGVTAFCEFIKVT